MSNTTFLAAFLGIPVVFVILDAADGFLTRRGRGDAESPRAEALLFLLVVFVVYGALQFGSAALVPSQDRLLVMVRAQVARVLGGFPSPEPIGGAWLVCFTVVTFYLAGLWDYALHRWFSHSRRFFFTHEYHHLPNQVAVTMPGMAVRPFAVVTSFPAAFATVVSAYALLAVLGLPLWDLAPLKILVLAHTFLLTATHSRFLRRWWWIHHGMKWLALTTPQEHLLHHTVDLEGNYGNFTVLWDRVFGTYLDPTLPGHQGHALGLGYDQDFLGAITMSKVKLPESVRRRFRLERYSNIETGSGEERRPPRHAP